MSHDISYLIGKQFQLHNIQSLHKEEKTRVQQRLINEDCYVTTTSRVKHAYCAMTVHFIVDFKLQSFLKSVQEFPDSHTTENIAQEINDTLEFIS